MRTYQNKNAQRERRWGAKLRLEENLKTLRKQMSMAEDIPNHDLQRLNKLSEKRMVKEIETLTARV